MKKSLLIITVLIAMNSAVNAQMEKDSVSLGAGYANDVWYSFENGQVASEAADNWHIAFAASGIGSSIILNGGPGNELWLYPGDTSDFATLDTTGMNSWKQLHNSDTSWAYGAFCRNQSGTDIGWGIYNMVTHQVVGDSLYVIKLSSGQYLKLWIVRLASGEYTFRYATLDNSSDETKSLTKSGFPDKNFAYFNLETGAALDREPNSADWELLFTKYTAFVPVPYPVSGILQNPGVEVAKAYPVDDPENFTDYGSLSFSGHKNVIGYNWKSFSGSWNIEDSLVYFVKANDGAVWKMVLTDFGGSANGNFGFKKENMIAAGVEETGTQQLVQLYPNPASNRFNVILHSNNNQEVNLAVHNITGKQVLSKQFSNAGLTAQAIDVSKLKPGIYTVTVQTGTTSKTQKLIIR